VSKLGELVLRNVWQLYRRWSPPPPASARNDSREAYIRWQFETSEGLFGMYPNFDIQGKSVLEIGCGTGGRAAWLATGGAARVVAIDINAHEIETAREMCPKLFPEIQGKVEYLASEEGDLLPLGEFDVVLLVDAMEHVVSPPAMMRLAHHYTAPGGKFYFSVLGWFHHSGSHMGILPFANVFFSDETLLNFTRWKVSRPGYKLGLFDSVPPTKRWEGLYDLRDRPDEHLNKITVREIKRLVKYSIFSQTTMTVCGFRHGPARWFNPLRHVPVLQEMFHSYVVVECRK
jgi:SAM-dependent methyltransferase